MSTFASKSRSATLRLVKQAMAGSSLRSFSNSSPAFAAAAAAAPKPTPSPSSSSTPRRTTNSASGARSAYSRTSTPASSSTPARKATPARTPAPAAADIFDHFASDDPSFPTPEPLSDVPDYAALAPRSTAAAAARPAANGDMRASEAPHGFDESPPSALDAASPDSNAAGDWSSSFHGLSARPFDKEVAQVLMRPLKPADVEIKPDGLLYLPEIKYRRTLNEAFGPGGWGLAPRSETTVGPRIVSREWALVCLGRLVAVARGEQEYFDPSGIPTAAEACKSNALMRCCKDLGIASELWDPSFIRAFKSKYCHEAFVEHATTKKKRKLWRKKEATFDYPYKEV